MKIIKLIIDATETAICASLRLTLLPFKAIDSVVKRTDTKREIRTRSESSERRRDNDGDNDLSGAYGVLIPLSYQKLVEDL